MYKGKVAQLTPTDQEILVMQFMEGWSFQDLQNAPTRVVSRAFEHMRAKAKASDSINKGGGSGNSANFPSSSNPMSYPKGTPRRKPSRRRR